MSAAGSGTRLALPAASEPSEGDAQRTKLPSGAAVPLVVARRAPAPAIECGGGDAQPVLATRLEAPLGKAGHAAARGVRPVGRPRGSLRWWRRPAAHPPVLSQCSPIRLEAMGRSATRRPGGGCGRSGGRGGRGVGAGGQPRTLRGRR